MVFGCKNNGTSKAYRERERGHFFRAHYAHLSKVVVFGCKNSGSSKGYRERETSLAALEREGVAF